jgi:hypothetical protein
MTIRQAAEDVAVQTSDGKDLTIPKVRPAPPCTCHLLSLALAAAAC